MKEFVDFIRGSLNKPLPERVGWPHVFGSMLLTVFLIQFISGVLLSFVYAPSPVGAYASVHYIANEMPGGAWLRGIHYWGASFLVILLGLHLIRTFLYAAYRKPRQATWIAGVALLLCTLAFAQTGYLLPWDQRAYWGTTVTIRIVNTAPLAGPWLADFLRGGPNVGALTLSRFYSIHVILLPLFTSALILFHLFLIQRHGITAPWTDTGVDAPRSTPFYPYQAARDAAAMLFILALLLILAALLPSPLDRPADPGDTTFVPRPDWYFLFLFQLLTFFERDSEIIGTFVLPTLTLTALFLLPWIDRNPSRLLRKRPLALLTLVVSVSVCAYLTYAAIRERPETPSWVRPPGITVPPAERIKRPSEVAGLFVMKRDCFECHSMTVLGSKPDLQSLSRHRFPSGIEWLREHLVSRGKTAELSEKDGTALMSTLRIVAERDPQVLYTIPPEVRFGGWMFYNKSCIRCHRIDGQGGQESEVKAPDLTRRLLRPKEWHMKHIKDSQAVVPKSKMPPFLHYEPHEYSALAEYILYLHSS